MTYKLEIPVLANFGLSLIENSIEHNGFVVGLEMMALAVKALIFPASKKHQPKKDAFFSVNKDPSESTPLLDGNEDYKPYTPE
jgi:hypothetical protein